MENRLSRTEVSLYAMIRAPPVRTYSLYESLCLHALTTETLVDNVLEDCFQLISLFFLTIGRNNEAPAV